MLIPIGSLLTLIINHHRARGHYISVEFTHLLYGPMGWTRKGLCALKEDRGDLGLLPSPLHSGLRPCLSQTGHIHLAPGKSK